MLTPIHTGQIQKANEASGVEPILEEQYYHRRNTRRNRLERVSSSIHKSLYQQITRLVGGFLQQVMGRDLHSHQPAPALRQSFTGQSFMGKIPADGAAANSPLEVRGIADRMPRLVDPNNPFPNRDLILLGEARDFPEPVIAIQYGDTIKPVFYEGNQVVARGLYLDCSQSSMDGLLVLANGTRLPVNIAIITAV